MNLFELKDENFCEFQCRLMPTVDKNKIIGIKTPVLKNIAKEMIKSGEYKIFLDTLPHNYFEENQLHAFIISELKDFSSALFEVNRFLPYIDNWATCDQLTPKSFKNNTDKLLGEIKIWIKSDKTYTVRFGIGILMRYFLDDKFNEKYLKVVSQIHSYEYYINMMIAWYFATALAKQYKKTLPYFEEKWLDKWVHNKAIQKARESFRVKAEHKEYLKSLKY